ncbi:snoal-like polyketide cyclase family protein [Neofusicoccum parvum]|uniref:Putative-like domain protein n=1 Tax=Botryosphaeria parva (strain UCR-NP2) TaxID=1287680 RepID=R1EYV0_BOTPV|nr:putative -like domain protein [Neofusicoccum parvum UCRNP2]GME41817.1 snoal-like polyketide cyclase family protein [Neofusicoccum parvum]
MYPYATSLICALASIFPVSTASTLFVPPTAALETNSTVYCPPRPASVAEQRFVFEQFVDLVFNQGKPTQAYLTYVSEDYIQHNPSVLSGRNISIAAFEEIVASGTTFEPLMTGFDANHGFVYSRVNFANAERPSAVADILRMNGSCIVEHWDVIQEMPENPVNPIALWG